VRPARLSLPTLPLQLRLAASAGILIGVTVILLYAVITSQLHRLSESALQDKAGTIARITAYSASPAVLFGDSTELAQTVASAILDPDLSRIDVRDADGELLELREVPVRQGPRHTSARADIVHDNRAIGSVEVTLSLARADAALARSRMGTGAVSSILFVLAILAAMAISAVVTEPVAKVSATASAIARGGALVHVHVESRDEVGALAASFNLMIDRLNAAQAELRTANATLEQRVQERTAELRNEVRERARAEAELRVSERRFRGIFESAGMGIALLDAHGHVVDANAALLRTVVTAEDHMVGTAFERHLEASDVPLFLTRLSRLRGGTSNLESAPLQLVDSTGAIHAVVCTVSALAGSSPEEAAFIVLIEDVTEQRQLEERFRQAQKLEAVGRLAGGIAHDFNNLLVTINGLADLLCTECSDPHIRRDLGAIRSAGERAAQLTGQLLAFSRRQVLQPQLVSMYEIVREVGGMLRRVIGEDIDLRLDLDENAGQVRADPGQLTQVIMNLAVNARDAMRGGGTLEVRTAAVDVDDAVAARFDVHSRGSHLLLSVSDTGTGMDEETQTQIFEPFFTTKPVGEGTGLGLATVYGIVRQSLGGITVESEPGVGTTFHVLFPSASGAAARPADHARPEREPRPTDGETILVVEDELTVRNLIARVLRRQGYRVLEAANGEQALELARADTDGIALLLTDIVMPGMGGPDLARTFHELRPDTPVIFMSGYTPEAARAETFGEGSAFLQKPMSPAALAHVVREVLDGATTAS
jgi:two-component system, cell cycle sensor histidine kinase and response regulator CckA